MLDQPIDAKCIVCLRRSCRAKSARSLRTARATPEVSGILAAFQRGMVGNWPSARSTKTSCTPVSISLTDPAAEDEKIANLQSLDESFFDGTETPPLQHHVDEPLRDDRSDVDQKFARHSRMGQRDHASS